MDILRSIYKFFTSYALATILLVLLFVITLLGTLDQVYLGLWGATQTYFHSWFVKSELVKNWKDISVPIILPGGLLLMILLFINMCLGAIVHVKKRMRGLPNLVTHVGILFLLVSGFVTFIGKNDGYVALFPEQSSNVVNSYKTWQLEILEFNELDQPTKAHIIPWKQLTRIGSFGNQKFSSQELPFSVQVESFLRNASPIPASAPMAHRAGRREVNGFKLMPLDKEKREERNLPGCFAKILVADEEIEELIVSAYSASHLAGTSSRVAAFKVADKQYGLQLVKTSWPIDYHIKLDRFIYEKHPGTSQPKNYESRVTRLENEASTDGKRVAIRMNEPMRHGGFVVFQESFGQHPESGEYFSQFAVSDNPSDRWPTVALTIMGIGLTMHFVWKLMEYSNRSRRQRAAK